MLDGAIDLHLPIAAQWRLYALGVVQGRRHHPPIDPVAAWLIAAHPHLAPRFVAPSVLSMMRARSRAIDSLIVERLQEAEARSEKVRFVSFGGDLDARWYRLRNHLGTSVHTHAEIDEPGLLGQKHELLRESHFTEEWDTIEQCRVPMVEWAGAVRPNGTTLVVLEGVANRIGPSALLPLLDALRRIEGVECIVDLPGFRTVADGPKSIVLPVKEGDTLPLATATLSEMGWSIAQDMRMARRPPVRAPRGGPVCTAVEALRVLHLR